jgi:outer membrane protein assembly factor BamB
LATATINGVKTQVVEAANKNGHAYIFKRDALTSGPLQDITLAPGGGGTCPDCSMGTISTAASDGTTYYQGMGMCNLTKTSNCAAAGFNSIMFALNPSNGSIKWQALIPKQIVSSPILLKDVLIVFEGNSIMILRTSNGTLVSQVTPTGANSVIDGSGAVARGRLFFSDLNGNFYEYGP